MPITENENVDDLDLDWDTESEGTQLDDNSTRSEHPSAASLLRKYDEELHPLAKIFPPMSDREFAGLHRSLKTEGQYDDIIMFEDKVLEGRHRYILCRYLGIEPRTKNLPDGANPFASVIAHNAHRRHLSPVQNAAVAADLKVHLAEQAKLRQHHTGGSNGGKGLPDTLLVSEQTDRHARESATVAAVITGAGVVATRKLVKVRVKAPDVFEAARTGKIATVAKAEKLSDLPSEARAAALALLDTQRPAKRGRTNQTPTPTSNDDNLGGNAIPPQPVPPLIEPETSEPNGNDDDHEPSIITPGTQQRADEQTSKSFAEPEPISNAPSDPVEALSEPKGNVDDLVPAIITPEPLAPTQQRADEQMGKSFTEPEPIGNAPSDPVEVLVVMYHELSTSDQARFLRRIDVPLESDDLESNALNALEHQPDQSRSNSNAYSAPPHTANIDGEAVRAALRNAIELGRTTAKQVRELLGVNERSIEGFLGTGPTYGNDKLLKIAQFLKQQTA